MPVGWVIEDDGKGKHQSFTARFGYDCVGGGGEHGLHIQAYGATEAEARKAAELRLSELAAFIDELRK